MWHEQGHSQTEGHGRADGVSAREKRAVQQAVKNTAGAAGRCAIDQQLAGERQDIGRQVGQRQQQSDATLAASPQDGPASQNEQCPDGPAGQLAERIGQGQPAPAERRPDACVEGQ
jgi:hypothetical protein